MAEPVANPYRTDESDQGRCAICGDRITQPRRGPVRVFCHRSTCRRTGAMRRRLANAWDEGYRAGAAGKVVAETRPDERRIHLATAHREGRIAAKREVQATWDALTTAIDWCMRNPTLDHRKSLQRALAATRASLSLQPDRMNSTESG